MKKYDYVVVLAGEIIKKDGSYQMPEFFDDLSQGMKTRLDATAKMFEDQTVSTIIVAGGKVRDSSDEKTDIMAEYLINKKIPEEKIVKIRSESNTQDNARAVKDYFSENKIPGTIALLTSFYHLPRAIKFFIEEGLCFEPIAAEAILRDDPNYGRDKIHDFYSRVEMLNRVDKEIEGLEKIEKEEYQSKVN